MKDCVFSNEFSSYYFILYKLTFLNKHMVAFSLGMSSSFPPWENEILQHTCLLPSVVAKKKKKKFVFFNVKQYLTNVPPYFLTSTQTTPHLYFCTFSFQYIWRKHYWSSFMFIVLVKEHITKYVQPIIWETFWIWLKIVIASAETHQICHKFRLENHNHKQMFVSEKLLLKKIWMQFFP